MYFYNLKEIDESEGQKELSGIGFKKLTNSNFNSTYSTLIFQVTKVI